MSQTLQLPRNDRFSAFTPGGETIWRWIGWAFVLYWVCFASNALAGQKILNTVGGILVLAVLAWATLERLWVKVDGVVIACLAAMLLPLVHLFGGAVVQRGEMIFKFESLCAVMVVAQLLRLPVISSSPRRWTFAVPVLIILALSLGAGHGAANDATRQAGLFLNPNNLALIPFLLLFLIDERRDPLWVRLGVHAIIMAVLVFSGTSGAFVAYAIGMAIHMRARLSKITRAIAFPMILIAGSGAAVLMLAGGGTFLPETRLAKQIALIGAEFDNVFEGGQVEYYKQERMLGAGATSAVWRLDHWRNTITKFADGTLDQQLFGFGIGSSEPLLGKLPHNEYLRILFEQGVVGFALFLFAWIPILARAPAAVRYVGVIVAIYSFSENNLDNFPFMSLFVLFMSATAMVLGRNRGGVDERPPVRFVRQIELCPVRSAQ